MTAQKSNVAPLSLESWVDLVKPLKVPGATVRGAFSVVPVEEDGSDIAVMQSSFKERKLWALLTDVSDGNDSQYLVLYGHALPGFLKGCVVEGYVFAGQAATSDASIYPVVPVDCDVNEALYTCITPTGERSVVRESSVEGALAYFEHEFGVSANELEIDVALPSLQSLVKAGRMSNHFSTSGMLSQP